MAPCRFFARGSCTYGARCKNSHDDGQDGQAPSLGPPLRATTSHKASNVQNGTVAQSGDSKEICWFFSQGTCTYGGTCRKSHDLVPGPSASSLDREIEIVSAPPTGNISATKSVTVQRLPIRSLKADVRPFVPTSSRANETLQDQATRTEDKQQSSLVEVDAAFTEIHGAAVTFSAGSRVSSIKLASDFSTIQISGMPAGAGQDEVRAVLAGLNFAELEATITVKQLGGIGAVADVKVENPTFATDATNRFQARQQEEQFRRLNIKPLLASSATGTLGNRLQLSTVSCSWYQASCVAWLTYPSHRAAEAALHRLKSRKIRGRVPDCAIQGGAFRSFTTTLQIGNLAPGTTAKSICAQLNGNLPTKTTIGDASYDASNDMAASIVREKLDKVGALASFDSIVVDGSNKIQALAVFVDRERALRAIRDLHSSKMPELGNSKLFLSQAVSVKYNVLSAVVDILKAEIDQLRSELWTKSHTTLRIYPRDPMKQFTAIKLFGEGHKDIADGKAAFESLLAGSVVMDQDSVLWCSYFSRESCLAYLQDFNKTHGVYINRDNRKLQLTIYGGSEATRNTVQEVLKDKVKSLETGTHKLILTPDLLQKAMRGGMKELKARFGSSVRLDVSLPKTISITGSAADFQEAQALLDATSNFGKEREDDKVESDCVVCWTEADDPLKLTCGHVYCKECFNIQASTTDGSQAVVCAEATCGSLFEMQELKSLLPYTTFENLRHASFQAYVRAHPKDFQYCPTPDCPQLYRYTEDGTAILCTHCLMSVCTSCKVVFHDGMSCEDYKDLSSEGTKAFEIYMKESDTRRCPKCTLAIQKTYGCNHMECAECKAHICWACMKVFETSKECYGHMTEAHGSYGI
ncbi:hypothetical protein ONS95_014291 [Cadophora gregata]|uniref:uncharacterized protein n=2 Tax=Cadophora gregata TaxID=51156 RepID=UPI0026DBCB5D|nr:uncharacterized protein ONS95_014291 [Cadophora gregata]KAK0114810.1 hypothetical protein ONS95_014291 [Cadophora gregata]